MPHVDEGQLHALLDGAFAEREAQALHDHIAACAQCAAQLEQARSLRERSRAILTAAQPLRLGTPPFEAVIAQAQQRSSTRRLLLLGPTRLAWAATVVLALGIGWFTRDLAVRQLPTESASSARNKEEVSAPAAAPAGAPTVSAATEPSVFRTDKAADVTGKLEQNERRPAEGFAAPPALDRAAKVSEPRRESKDAERDESMRKPVGAITNANVQTLPQGQRQAQVQLPGPVPSQVQGQMQSADSRAGQAGQAAGRALAPTAQIPPGVVTQFRDANTPLQWQYVSLQRAEQMVGRRVLRVPDLEIISVGVASSATGFLVRAIQRLPDNGLLELHQQPQVAQAPALVQERAQSELRAGAREATSADAIGGSVLTLQRQDVVLTGRAFVSVDSLRVLLQRVR